jgi:ribosomal-protein-alanine acetyltransferase
LKPSIEVREFQLADLDHILAVEQASFLTDAWDKKIFLAYYRKCADLFLVVRIGRRVAGYVITCAGSRNAELVSIAVDPRDRRRGVGQALLRRTLAELRSRRVKTWWLMVGTANEPGIRFYEKYGFTRVKVVKRYYGAGRDAWRMRFKLV